MSKFKPGDRIRVSEGYKICGGKTGVVVDESIAPWVAMDEPTHPTLGIHWGGIPLAKEGFMACICQDYMHLAEALP